MELALIDKSIAIQKLCAACSNNGSFACISCVVPAIIKEIPAIETEPVQHGRWIECDYKEIRHGEIWTEHRAGLCCSECHIAFHKKKMTYKQYCAACGAKMDGGAENGNETNPGTESD